MLIYTLVYTILLYLYTIDNDTYEAPVSRYAKQESESHYKKVEIMGSSLGVQNIKAKFTKSNLTKSIDKEKDTIRAFVNLPVSTPRDSITFRSGISANKAAESGLVVDLIRVAEAAGVDPKAFLATEPEGSLGVIPYIPTPEDSIVAPAVEPISRRTSVINDRKDVRKSIASTETDTNVTDTNGTEADDPLASPIDSPRTSIALYSYRELVRQNYFKEYAADVKPHKLEAHLGDGEFEAKFGVNKVRIHAICIVVYFANLIMHCMCLTNIYLCILKL